MSGRGRPLRFLGTVLGGWTLLRTWALWPIATGGATLLPLSIWPLAAPVGLPAPYADPGPAPLASSASVAQADPSPVHTLVAVDRSRHATRGVEVAATVASAARPRHAPDPGRVRLAQAALLRFGEPVPQSSDPARAAGSRWSGSAWLIARPGGATTPATLAAGQLGGSQAGARIVYALDAERHWALTGRVSAPLHGAGKELGVGVAWRPTRAAVTLVAEARVPLDGGRVAPVVGIIAGLNPTPIAAGFRLEAYGQAGAIARNGVEGFADGAARLARPLTTGAVGLDLGVGAWGGVQRGAARLDLGPTLGATVRVAGQPLRVALDWRQRVAGEARPGSGPALSLGTDF